MAGKRRNLITPHEIVAALLRNLCNKCNFSSAAHLTSFIRFPLIFPSCIFKLGGSVVHRIHLKGIAMSSGNNIKIAANNPATTLDSKNIHRESNKPRIRRTPKKKKTVLFGSHSLFPTGDGKVTDTNDSFDTYSQTSNADYLDDIIEMDQAELLSDDSNKHTYQHITNTYTTGPHTNNQIKDPIKFKRSACGSRKSIEFDFIDDLFGDDDLLEGDDDKSLFRVNVKAPPVAARADSTGPMSRKIGGQQSYQIEVPHAKIDRLAATIQVPLKLRQFVVAAALTLNKSNVPRGAWLEKAYVAGGTRYQNSFRVYWGGPNGRREQLGLIQLNPPNKEHAFLRIELNPDAIGKDGCIAFKDLLKRILGGDAMWVVAGAKITLLDIAVDVNGIPIDALLLFSNKCSESLVWGRHFDRNYPDRLNIQTQQIGSKKSRKSTTIYDKRAERLSKGLLRGTGQECVRVEGRLHPTVNIDGKPRHGIYLNELSQLPNPLAHINIALYLPSGNKDWMFDLFLDATQQIGTQAALAKVSRALRSSYRKRLKEGVVDWWRPDEIISKVPAALKATGLFPPQAFS